VNRSLRVLLVILAAASLGATCRGPGPPEDRPDGLPPLPGPSFAYLDLEAEDGTECVDPARTLEATIGLAPRPSRCTVPRGTCILFPRPYLATIRVGCGADPVAWTELGETRPGTRSCPGLPVSWMDCAVMVD
jgi:hypothetical protein